MNRKFFFKTLLFTLVVTVSVSALVLVIHIREMKALAEERKKQDVLLLGRIDFNESPDSVKVSGMLSDVRNMRGIKGVHYNSKDKTLVYTYMSLQQSNAAVLAHLQTQWKVDCRQYKVNAEDLMGGCPAGFEEKGFMASVSSGFSKLFN